MSVPESVDSIPATLDDSKKPDAKPVGIYIERHDMPFIGVGIEFNGGSVKPFAQAGVYTVALDSNGLTVCERSAIHNPNQPAAELAKCYRK